MKTLIERYDEMLGLMRKQLSNFAKNGTGVKDKKRQPFGNKGSSELGAYTNSAYLSCKKKYENIAERKRTIKPPEKTLSNDEYRKLQKGKDWRKMLL
jgi:hypothetical protein